MLLIRVEISLLMRGGQQLGLVVGETVETVASRQVALVDRGGLTQGWAELYLEALMV